MKSNKQRRLEIKERRLLRAEKTGNVQRFCPGDCVSVNLSALAPGNSYDVPAFVERGFYKPVKFKCRDCGVREIWTAKQQKLWYEKWRGSQESRAIRCRACRAKKRIHDEASRAGMIKKNESKNENTN